MVKIIMNGCNGKMGSVITDIVSKDSEACIVAGIDVNNVKKYDYPVFSDITDCDVEADVIIDFTTATAVDKLVDYSVSKKIPAIICTTGLSENTIKKIDEASKNVAVFRSGNMSLGVNLLSVILKKYSEVLYGAGFDVEIVERHHNKKIDAPSGTAMMLADSVNASVDDDLEYVFDRSSVREQRKHTQLGISAVRGGTIVGDHEVIFAGRDEVVEFKHTAYSKEIFAIGAVKAAKFIKGKTSGMYDMQDVLSEELA
ncbi:MAG TPA: 4-hydroxy-tetrahydrodipicolinate reductase [Lachnospiraceae bacterium]|nr:4-hydroxy-tetrahydrodipicolinate reductase [Lachnospiraceae bacterium]